MKKVVEDEAVQCHKMLANIHTIGSLQHEIHTTLRKHK